MVTEAAPAVTACVAPVMGTFSYLPIHEMLPPVRKAIAPVLAPADVQASSVAVGSQLPQYPCIPSVGRNTARSVKFMGGLVIVAEALMSTVVAIGTPVATSDWTP